MSLDLARLRDAIAATRPARIRGRVVQLTGLAVEVVLPGARHGELVRIETGSREGLLAEVAGLREERAVLLPLGEPAGLGVGAEVIPTGRPLSILAGEGLLGRILDGLGRPLDGRALPDGLEDWAIDRPAPHPLARRRVTEPLPVGVRALDGLITLGEGQRVGLFAGPGVGKSSLLGQVARGTRADLSVVCLLGERGREVRDFLEESLGPRGLERSVVVVATSDAPPLVRIKAASAATAVAEWFAGRGARVLLLLDSLTRLARAQREAGLASGELPVRHGYPPSVFQLLPRLLERAGNRERGGITALYTVLVAGGDLDEPVADEVRGLLDGHVVLDRGLAERGHWPAIDVLRSLSRSMPAVTGERHRAAAARMRELLAAHERQRDLIGLGAYRRGSDPVADAAIDRMEAIEGFLRQGHADDGEPLARTVERLSEVVA